MLTDEQLDVIGETLVPLFNALEKEVTTDIARRIAKTMTYSRTAELQAIALQKLGYSPSKIRSEAMKTLRADKEFRQIVAKNTIEYKKEIQRSIDRTVLEARLMSDEVIAKAGNMSWIADLRLWKDGGIELTDKSFLSGMVEGIQRQTGAELVNLSRSTGFKTISGWESIENAYQRELDKAMIKLLSGTFSQEKVVNDVVKSLARSGLRSIDFASGTSRELSSAVSTAVRTGANQLNAQMMNKNIESTGQNLVYVSEHANARNKGVGVANHEEWQGKVYYIEPVKDYSEEAQRIGQKEIDSLEEKTGYSINGISDPLGLHGYNCRHQHYVWFEGVSTLPERLKPRPNVTYNGKTYDGYAQTQEMRKRERDIRSLKRELEAKRSLGEDTTELEKTIEQKTREYKEFCQACGVRPSNSKLRYETNASDLKNTKAYKDFDKIASEVKEEEIKLGADTSVDWKYINTQSFSEKFETIGKNREVGMKAKEISLKMLKHRDNTEFEDLCFIDYRTGNMVLLIDNVDIKSGVTLTDEQKEFLDAYEGELLAIHNHPANSRLSFGDLVANQERIKVTEAISVGHKGSVYSMSNINRKIDLKALYNNIYSDVYLGNKDIAYSKTMDNIFSNSKIVSMVEK